MDNGEIMKYTIQGTPVILKNNKQISRNRHTGKVFIRSSDRVQGAKKSAALQFQAQHRGDTINGSVSVKMAFYGAWKKGGGNVPDLSNLYQFYEDTMQGSVIHDDSQIESHDGSRRVYMCDSCHKRELYKAGPKKGQLKPDCGAVKRCPFERVEIDVELFEKDLT